MGQQQSAELGPPLLGRLVEGRERPLVGGVDARVVLDQQGGDVHVLNAGEGRKKSRRVRKQSAPASPEHKRRELLRASCLPAGTSCPSFPSSFLSNTIQLVPSVLSVAHGSSNFQ